MTEIKVEIYFEGKLAPLDDIKLLIETTKKDDFEYVKLAVSAYTETIEVAKKEFRENKELGMIVSKDPMLRGFLSLGKNLLDDKDIALCAVKSNGDALQYLSKKMRDDEDVVIEAIKSEQYSITPYKYASDRLKNIPLMAMSASYYSEVKKFIPENLKKNKYISKIIF
jgi:hypothetical protein